MNLFLPYDNNRIINKVNYSLGNTFEAKELLFKRLSSVNESCAVCFKKDVRIGVYRFDFFCEELNLAINIDAISDNFDEFYNNDQIKTFRISHKSIRVMKVTDYQVLLDLDQVVRYLKNNYLNVLLT